MTPDNVWRAPNRIFDGYALDLDGTVYLGDELLAGAAQVLAALRSQSAVVFVTNKPLETAESYARKLTRLGIETSSADIVTPLDSLVHYLGEHHQDATLLTVAEELVDNVLREAGFEVVSDPYDAAVVVVSFDRTFTYAKLLAAFRAVRNGATIVATNPDPFCPTPDGGLPDCAAHVRAGFAHDGLGASAGARFDSRQHGRAVRQAPVGRGTEGIRIRGNDRGAVAYAAERHQYLRVRRVQAQ